mgnify:CR=1 FL=1
MDVAFQSAAPFLLLSSLASAFGLQPTDVIIAAISAAGAGAILTRFTHSLGLITYLLNVLALATGALIANMLMAGVDLPIEAAFERPILLSLAGITVASVLMLFLLGDDGSRA